MGEFNRKIDESVAEIVESYKVEAANMMIDAFNQGYLLGQQHAKTVLGEGDKK